MLSRVACTRVANQKTVGLSYYCDDPKLNGTCQVGTVNEAKWVQQIYREHIVPKLAPHQRLMAIPGTFWDLHPTRSGSRDEQDALLAKKIEGYRDWLAADPQLVGLQMWHWFTEGPPLEPSKPWALGGGLDRLPKTVAALRQILKRELPAPPQGPPPQAGLPSGPSIEEYCTVWTTPSPAGPDSGSLASMPLGNGDLAVNVWTDNSTNGDLMLYLAKNDAFDSTGELIKLGRIRVAFAPPLIAADGAAFIHQRLDLSNATVTIRSGGYTVDVWVTASTNTVYIDASHDALNMECKSLMLSHSCLRSLPNWNASLVRGRVRDVGHA